MTHAYHIRELVDAHVEGADPFFVQCVVVSNVLQVVFESFVPLALCVKVAEHFT